VRVTDSRRSKTRNRGRPSVRRVRSVASQSQALASGLTHQRIGSHSRSPVTPRPSTLPPSQHSTALATVKTPVYRYPHRYRAASAACRPPYVTEHQYDPRGWTNDPRHHSIAARAPLRLLARPEVGREHAAATRDGGTSPSTSPCSHKRRYGHRPRQRSPGCEPRALMRRPRRPQSCSTRTHHITMPCG
jgi:hypothetical protein